MLVHRLSFQLTANSGHLFLVKPCVLYDSVVNNTSHTPNFMFELTQSIQPFQQGRVRVVKKYIPRMRIQIAEAINRKPF